MMLLPLFSFAIILISTANSQFVAPNFECNPTELVCFYKKNKLALKLINTLVENEWKKLHLSINETKPDKAKSPRGITRVFREKEHLPVVSEKKLIQLDQYLSFHDYEKFLNDFQNPNADVPLWIAPFDLEADSSYFVKLLFLDSNEKPINGMESHFIFTLKNVEQNFLLTISTNNRDTFISGKSVSPFKILPPVWETADPDAKSKELTTKKFRK